MLYSTEEQKINGAYRQINGSWALDRFYVLSCYPPTKEQLQNSTKEMEKDATKENQLDDTMESKLKYDDPVL